MKNKKQLLLIASLLLPMLSLAGCKKQSQANSLTKEQSAKLLAEKAVIPYEGGQKIVFKTFDGQKIKAVYTSDPYSYKGEIPTREDDEKYHYLFSGWNVTYDFDAKETIATAQYEKELRKYEISFVSDGQVISKDYYEYGTIPVAPDGFEATESIKPVYRDQKYINKVNYLSGDYYSEGLIFVLLDNKTEFAVNNYFGEEENIVIPETYNNLPVTAIQQDAFINAPGIKTINIPKTVKNIEANAFRGLESFEYFELDEENPVYKLDSSGAIYYIETDSHGEEYKYLLYVPSGKSDLLEISDSYFRIVDGALNKTNATTLKLASDFLSMCDIFGGTFDNNVKSVILTSGYIHDKMFMDMTELYSVTIYEDDGLGVNDFGTYIGEKAFKGCSNLRGISIPSQITRIEDEAFAGCTSLEDVRLSFDELTIEYVGTNAFLGDENLKGYDKDGVIYLGNPTYKYQIPVIVTDNVSPHVEIPKDTLLIPERLFEKNQIIEDLTFEEDCRIKRIGEKAFNQCVNLDLYSNIHYLPTSLTEVGYMAFSNTKYDENKSAWLYTRIDETDCKYCLVNLIKNCTTWQITKYTKFVDPYGLKNGIDDLQYKDGVENSTFTIHNGKILTTGYTVLHATTKTTTVDEAVFQYRVPYIGVIAPYAFKDISSLTTCIFLNKSGNNNSISQVGEYAFYYCVVGGLYLNRYLKSVGAFAFKGSIKANTTLKINKLLTYAGSEAFNPASTYYGYTLQFESDHIPETWDINFDGEQGNHSKNTYQFNIAF
jgi:hypothetical protein